MIDMSHEQKKNQTKTFDLQISFTTISTLVSPHCRKIETEKTTKERVPRKKKADKAVDAADKTVDAAK